MKLFKLRKLVALSALSLGGFLAISIGTASALTYNNNNVMDDAVFDNYNSMSAGQINNFLNSFPNSCLSPNNGFSAIDPTGYNPTNGFLYGGNVSAGQVIYDAAQAYQINPQVLLATLQKEQSIVDGSAGCSTNQISKAAGYGCPDGGTSYNYSNVNLYTKNGVTYTSVSGICVNSAAKAGFSQQVIHAAWMLKYSEQRSEGNINWAIITGNWDNSDDLTSTYSGYMTQGCFKRSKYDSQCTNFDGYATIDNTAVHMDTGATAALYRYTPHFSGNQNFDNIFTNWFGDVHSNDFALSWYAFSGYPTVQAGSNATEWVEYKNTGGGTFFDNTESSINGSYPLHLADSSPVNRPSQFYDSATWFNNNRPSTGFAAVYENDGTTLAADQHKVLSGQIVKFTFNYSVPLLMQAGQYVEPLQPIREGAAQPDVGGWGWIAVNVTDPDYRVTYVSQSSNSISAKPWQWVDAWVKYQNTGTQPLYDNSSVPTNDYPLHLADSSPVNRPSQFYDSATWFNNNRPSTGFAAVYENDGTTLAADQHVAQPGQIVKFAYRYKVPGNESLGSYSEPVQPIMEGSPNAVISNTATFNLNVQQPVAYQVDNYSMSAYPSGKAGTTQNVWLEYENIGTQPLYDNSSVPSGNSPLHLADSSPVNRPSQFYDSATWFNNNRPSTGFAAVYENDGTTLAADQHVAQPGQIVKFAYNYNIPADAQPGSYVEPTQPIREGAADPDVGGGWGWFALTVTP